MTLIITALAAFSSLSLVYGQDPAAAVPSSEPSIQPDTIAGEASNVAQFGQPFRLLGAMTNTVKNFPDGLTIDLHSPAPRDVRVTQNNQPLDGRFVTGSTGENWMAMQPFSYIVNMTEPANDLISQIALPFDRAQLQQMGVDPSNTYVGILASDKKSWQVLERQRTVQLGQSKTLVQKMTSIEGEYMLLGRKDVDSSNIFIPFGEAAVNTANFTGGGGRQSTEFMDGLRLSLVAQAPMGLQVTLDSGISQELLPPNTQPLYSFAYNVKMLPAQAPTTSPPSPNPVKRQAPPGALAPPTPGAPAPPAPAAAAPNPAIPAPAQAAPSQATPGQEGQGAAPQGTANLPLLNDGIEAEMQFPINMASLAQITGPEVAAENLAILIARRDLGSTGKFEPTNRLLLGDMTDGRVVADMFKPLQGQYAVLIEGQGLLSDQAGARAQNQAIQGKKSAAVRSSRRMGAGVVSAVVAGVVGLGMMI